jgi:hypothetical protein
VLISKSGNFGWYSEANRFDRPIKVVYLVIGPVANPVVQTCHTCPPIGKTSPVIWTSPLYRSHRDDQNAYVELSIWCLDERVMALARFSLILTGVTGQDGQFDQFAQIWVRSCILTRNLYNFWLLVTKISHPIKLKGHDRLRATQSNQTNMHLLFYLLDPKPLFQPSWYSSTDLHNQIWNPNAHWSFLAR